MSKPTLISVSELRLGDVFKFHFPYSEVDEGYNSMTVVKITPSYVEYVRPYIHTADFSMLASIRDETGSGVIDYIGTERSTMLKDYSGRVKLCRRGGDLR